MNPILFSMIVLTCLCESCQSKEQVVTNENNMVETKNPTIDIRYSKNLETFALLYNLSESGAFHFEHNPSPRAMLARKITERFSRFKEHEAVKKLNFLLNNDFVDSYDIVLSLYNTEFPDFRQYTDYPPIYYEHDSLSPNQVRAIFDEFNESVKKFYKDANLEEFFKIEMKALYVKLMNEVKTVAPANEYIMLMEDYYGIQRNSYTVIVSAFSFNGIGRSKTIRNQDGINIYQFVSSNPEDESDTIDLNDINSFTIGYTNKEYFREIAIHELGHSFYHEALRENKNNTAKIDELEYLFTTTLKENMRNQGYVDWRMCFEEHLVRLGEIKIAELMGELEFAERYSKECIADRGFVYLQPLKEIFLKYENNRIKYKSIGDFMPFMISELKEKIPNHKK